MKYEYRCSECNSILTIERSIHEDAKDPGCFDCHVPMSRVYDAPAITFKGRGFYTTDK